MAYEFNAAEIFDIACQIERNGADFYKRMSNTVSDSQIRKMFTNFASMENAHEKVFESMRKELTALEQSKTIFDAEEETGLYLKAMADIHVFDQNAGRDFNLSDELPDNAKRLKILRFAVDLEWASIAFYTGIREFVPETFGRTKIEYIIKEEMGHVRLLSDQLKS